ncbi:MAG: hypothetical protein IJ688_02590 [Treponema sp.]|nr:hypothetical protein [Treponema sp.]
MTIRSRNRVNFIFLILSALILLLNIGEFCYHFFTNNITYPLPPDSNSNFFLFRYSFWSIIASIFMINIYVVVTSYIIFRTFEKTQATEVLFFLVFLTSLLFDTSRLYVPVYGLVGSYSDTLIHIGNLTLAARLLAPISLFALTAFSGESFRQQTEQNCLIAILVSIFFAIFLPLNTTVIRPNLCLSYGFTKAVHIFSIITSIISVITLFIHNNNNDFSQLNTLGFIMLIIGYNTLFSCYNFAAFIVGLGVFASGTALYLTKLHQHYLWID